MTLWILAVLALWVAQIFLPSGLRFLAAKDSQAYFADHMRGKDDPPPDGPLVGRAQRAFNNLQESMPVFLGVALLLEIHGDGVGVTGAMIFFVARVLYVPAYLSAVFGLRTVMWVGGWVGLAMMISALLQIVSL